MNCIIIEDQLPAQRILKKYIVAVEYLNLIGSYTNAVEAIKALKTHQVDLIFLDIHLPKISGIEFLKTLSNPPHVILTTAFSDYALESYEYNVVDYLLKPFSFQRFIKALSKIPAQSSTEFQEPNHSPTHHTEVYIKSGYEHIRIKLNDILYIMSDSDYTEIYLKNKKHLSSESLRYWENFLPKQQFMRIHKSYIINTSVICKVARNIVHLDYQKTIPIGRAYKNAFIEQFFNKN